MKLNKMKKLIFGITFAIIFIFGAGMISETTTQAQDRGRYYQRDRDWERNREWNRQRNNRTRDWRRDRNWDQGRYSRQYPNYGGYDRYNGAYNSELQRGFRNGLKEGSDDARDRDGFNPNRHSSFRDGNSAYRSGFARGYDQGFRQYAGYNRRW